MRNQNAATTRVTSTAMAGAGGDHRETATATEALTRASGRSCGHSSEGRGRRELALPRRVPNPEPGRRAQCAGAGTRSSEAGQAAAAAPREDPVAGVRPGGGREPAAGRARDVRLSGPHAYLR